MNENYVEPIEEKETSLKETLISDRWNLLILALIGLGLAIYFGYEPEIPRWLRLFGVAMIATFVLGYAPASRLVQWLYSPNFTYLIDLDSRTDEFAIWQLPAATWRDLDVTDGDLYEVRSTAPCWECRGYDPETNTAKGTWRGSASDLELIENRERIDEIRTILEELAKEGLTIRVKQSGIIRDAIRGIVMSFVAGFERETLYDGDEIDKSVEKALSRWEFDSAEKAEEKTATDGSDTEVNLDLAEEPDPLAEPKAVSDD